MYRYVKSSKDITRDQAVQRVARLSKLGADFMQGMCAVYEEIFGWEASALYSDAVSKSSGDTYKE